MAFDVDCDDEPDAEASDPCEHEHGGHGGHELDRFVVFVMGLIGAASVFIIFGDSFESEKYQVLSVRAMRW